METPTATLEVIETKVDWKQKLSSRKFWAMLAGFLVPLFTLVGCSQNEIAQIVGVVISGGAVCSYILGESWVDSARESAPVYLPESFTWDEGDANVA